MKKFLFLFTYLVVFYFFTSLFSSETNIISFSEKSLLFEENYRDLPPKKLFCIKSKNKKEKRKKNTTINNQVQNKIIIEKRDEEIKSLPLLIQPEDNFFQKYSIKNINSSEKSVNSLKRGSSNGKGSNKKRKIGLKEKSSEKIYVNYKKLVGIVKKTLNLTEKDRKYNKKLREKILNLPGVNLNEKEKKKLCKQGSFQKQVRFLITEYLKKPSEDDVYNFINNEFPGKNKAITSVEQGLMYYLFYVKKTNDTSLKNLDLFNIRFTNDL